MHDNMAPAVFWVEKHVDKVEVDMPVEIRHTCLLFQIRHVDLLRHLATYS